MATVNGTENSDIINAVDGVDWGADRIFGFGGDDVISGLGGHDTIEGGAGADSINGGPGTDTAAYTQSESGVTVSLASNEGSGGDAEGDTLNSIENLAGSDHDDTLYGNAGNNVLIGLDGDDILKGGGGADTLDAGDGADILKGGGGADSLNGGLGIDTVSYEGSAAAVWVDLDSGTGSGGDAQGDTLTSIEQVTGSAYNDILAGDREANTLRGGDGHDSLKGGGGDDTLEGQGGNDFLFGGDLSDVLLGGDGDDLLNGGEGSDTMNGGDGLDTLSYAGSYAGVVINLGGGTALGGEATGDVYTSVENLAGSSHSDSLFGDHLANQIDGGDGDDYLFGAAGNDTFMFEANGFGDDSILDFTPGSDRIRFSTDVFADFDAVLASVVAYDGGIWLVASGGSSVGLDNIQAADLSASDFMFV
jgi:Ca2+-binding RTX toxin-like protein